MQGQHATDSNGRFPGGMRTAEDWKQTQVGKQELIYRQKLTGVNFYHKQYVL